MVVICSELQNSDKIMMHLRHPEIYTLKIPLHDNNVLLKQLWYNVFSF